MISLMEMDASTPEGSGRPQMPEGMEGFEGFDPSNFSGNLPEGNNFPQWGEGEMPQMPEGMEIPEGMEFPEGMTMPADGQRPDFGGEGQRPGMCNFSPDMETKTLDIGNAHISVEIEEGKASGSMSDIVPGAYVTITLNGKGEATYVLVSSRSAFGGGRPAWGNQ